MEEDIFNFGGGGGTTDRHPRNVYQMVFLGARENKHSMSNGSISEHYLKHSSCRFYFKVNALNHGFIDCILRKSIYKKIVDISISLKNTFYNSNNLVYICFTNTDSPTSTVPNLRLSGFLSFFLSLCILMQPFHWKRFN